MVENIIVFNSLVLPWDITQPLLICWHVAYISRFNLSGSLGVTMEEVVDAQMEILAQCMEACQALFMMEEKQNYWMGQMRKREKGQEWPFLWLWWSSSLRAPLGERRNDGMLMCKLETLSAVTKLWKGRGGKIEKKKKTATCVVLSLIENLMIVWAWRLRIVSGLCGVSTFESKRFGFVVLELLQIIVSNESSWI